MDRSSAPNEWVDLGDESAIDESLTRCSISPERALGTNVEVGVDVDAEVGSSRGSSGAGIKQPASSPTGDPVPPSRDTAPEPMVEASAQPQPSLDDIQEPLVPDVNVPAGTAEECEVKMEDGVKDDREAKSARDSITPLREIGVDIPEPDDRQCRICLGGAEDEAEMGRLISPCLCTGSMRFVHINCINEWRGTGANAKSFMECPQCSYEYAIRRTAVVGLATSRPLLFLLTTVIFFMTTLVAGHLLFKYRVALVEEEVRQEAKETAGPKKSASYIDDRDDMYIWESNIVFLGGATLIYDIMTQAIHTFVIFAGDVYDVFAEDGGRISNLLVSITVRLILGLSVLGSFSGLTLLASLSLFAPLQLIYALKGTGIFNGLRRRINSKNGTYLIVAFVLIGIVNSIVQVYDLVHSVTSKILRYVETQIVEVHSPEARAMRRSQRVGWWHRWWAERRWRTAAGWSEVRLRAWIGVKEWARKWKAAAAAAMHGGGETVNVAG